MESMKKLDPKFYASKLRRNCTEVSTLLRALSHPSRLMILGHLIEGEKSVSEIQKLCGISQSQVSQFLSRMKLENLVVSSRMGRNQYYAAADTRLVTLVLTLQSLYCK